MTNIIEAKSFINDALISKGIKDFSPSIGIVLGTGLNAMAKEINVKHILDYTDIPHFPVSTVESHTGRLILGTIENKNVVAMQGRFHYYEGYSMQEISFPIRVMKLLGVKTLLISNACGSLNPLFKKGSLMLIDDYINLLGSNPLIGKHCDDFGVRFPDMSEPYSQKLIKMVEEIALKNEIKIHKGIYAAMPGPCLETRAEYRFLRTIGADAIGMSTVPETIVAKQLGLEVVGISILTDECYPECLVSLTLEEIIEVANSAEPYLTKIFKELINRL